LFRDSTHGEKLLSPFVILIFHSNAIALRGGVQRCPACQFTRFSRPAQNGARNSVFNTLPAPDKGNGMSRMSTLRGHL